MSNQGQGLLSHFYLGFAGMLCAYTRPRSQVSVFRTIGPLVCMYTTLGQGQEMTLTFNTHIPS